MSNAGKRVVAVSHADNKTVYIFGHGTYEGDVVPEPKGGMATLLSEMGLPNPLIKTDDGKSVYGCECWFGPEEGFEEQFVKGREVVTVDIDVLRLQAEGDGDEA